MSDDFEDILASEALEEGKAVSVVAGGRPVAVVRVSGRVYAVDGTCPHRGGPLGEGDLEGHHLYCPLHAWSFDVRDGGAFFPRGARVACFEAVERNGRIFVKRSPRPGPKVDFTPPTG